MTSATPTRRAGRRLAMLLLLTTMLSTTACAHRSAGEGLLKPECLAYQPIYLSEGAIAALAPFRADREQIAVHNRVWEQRCGTVQKG